MKSLIGKMHQPIGAKTNTDHQKGRIHLIEESEFVGSGMRQTVLKEEKQICRNEAPGLLAA
jgi:hypothetical protein